MLVYCDDPVQIGARLEVELLLSTEATIELHARVVRVDTLPPAAPAAFDVALEFLEVSDAARAALTHRLGLDPPASGSEPRVHDEQREQVNDVERNHGEKGLLQAPPGVPRARGPAGDRDVREEERDQDELLHRSPSNTQARDPSPRNGVGRERRLRVLFVAPYLPSPPRFGGQRRLHGLIAGLAEDHDVSVLSLVDPSEDHTESVRATEAYCREVVIVPNHR